MATYLEDITREYGKKLGVQPIEIVASTTNGNYPIPDGNALIRDCRILGVTARAIPDNTTRYTPLNNIMQTVSVTDNAYLTLKCASADIVLQLPYEVITDMQANGLVHPLDIQGLTLNQSGIFVPNAGTVMLNQTGKAFLLTFYGLFN